jgi:DNA repair protein RecO (recombination protein O)
LKKHFKTDGIVLRKVDFGEADRIITVLTVDRGKIDCVAKGARRYSSRFCGRLELFNRVSLDCFQGRELACVREAEVIRAFEVPGEPLLHRALFTIAELTHRLIQSGQEVEGAYPLLTETLQAVADGSRGFGGSPGRDAISPDPLPAYITRLLTLTGYVSSWDHCARCNSSFDIKRPLHLCPTDSALLCEHCAGSCDPVMSSPVVRWILYMQKAPLKDCLRVRGNPQETAAVWHWLESLLINLFGTLPRSAVFYAHSNLPIL